MLGLSAGWDSNLPRGHGSTLAATSPDARTSQGTSAERGLTPMRVMAGRAGLLAGRGDLGRLTQRPRNPRIPASSPAAYRLRPVVLRIRAASDALCMLPSSTMTTGTSDQLSVPRSRRTLMPSVA